MKEIHYESLYKHELNHWWFKTRRKLARTLIMRHTAGTALEILDIGCGTGALLHELADVGHVYGVDCSQTAVTYCKNRGIKNVILGDITSIPFPDGQFDVVLALDVLEHIDDDTAAVHEIRRVLKPNGVAIIFVPAFMFLWGSTDIVSEHKRRYTELSFVSTLKRGGLEVVRSSYFNFFLFLPITAVRLAARLFSRGGMNENDMGNSFINNVLHMIFSLEVRLLPYVSFPIGVSIMAVCKADAKPGTAKQL